MELRFFSVGVYVGAGTSSMVYRMVMASEISSRGSIDLENVVGAEELLEDELN